MLGTHVTRNLILYAPHSIPVQTLHKVYRLLARSVKFDIFVYFIGRRTIKFIDFEGRHFAVSELWHFLVRLAPKSIKYFMNTCDVFENTKIYGCTVTIKYWEYRSIQRYAMESDTLWCGQCRLGEVSGAVWRGEYLCKQVSLSVYACMACIREREREGERENVSVNEWCFVVDVSVLLQTTVEWESERHCVEESEWERERIAIGMRIYLWVCFGRRVWVSYSQQYSR